MSTKENWRDLLNEQNSPYKVAKVESLARGKNVVPQKLYQYVATKRIVATKNELNKWMISKAEATKYIERAVAKDELQKRFA